MYVYIYMVSLLYSLHWLSNCRAQLEEVAVLEKEKRELKEHANSLEAQLLLKGRVVKEMEGRMEQVEEKHKEVGTHCYCHRGCSLTYL